MVALDSGRAISRGKTPKQQGMVVGWPTSRWSPITPLPKKQLQKWSQQTPTVRRLPRTMSIPSQVSEALSGERPDIITAFLEISAVFQIFQQRSKLRKVNASAPSSVLCAQGRSDLGAALTACRPFMSKALVEQQNTVQPQEGTVMMMRTNTS